MVAFCRGLRTIPYVAGESEQARLLEAEGHQRILSDVSRALLDYVGADEVEPLRRIVEMVATAMGDWCAFSLVQPDGLLHQVAAWHRDPEQRTLAEKVWKVSAPQRWDVGPAEYNPLIQQRPLAFEHITDEMLRAGSRSPEQYELIKAIGMTSAISAPMFDGKEPLGTMLLVSTGPGGRRYSDSDHDFAFALAGRAALAVRNARLVRSLAEERDRQERARKDLVSVLENDPNGVGIFNNDGTLRYASPTLEMYFGVPLREMIGRPFREIYTRKFEQMSEAQRPKSMARIEQIFSDPFLRSTDEIELERPRLRHLQRTSVPIIGATGSVDGRLFVYVDITAQRELDRQRSDFLTVAAHELRTPLTPLSMYLQNIERRIARGESVDVALATKARRQVGRLSRLVEDVLDVSRLEAKRMTLAREAVDLEEVAEHVVADFRASSRVHELVLSRPSSPLRVTGDRQRLEQVFVNLIQNAIKYSPSGGQVIVALDAQDGLARVSVTDSGIGIPHEEREKLFQRFFRAKNANTRNYGGLGIGLYVSHEIIAQHGGRFEVESEPGKGSTFRFLLPLSEESRSRKQRRILLVDDDPEILEATGQVLREWGYRVDEARDGVTALQLARSSAPDLMLVDLMMPVMDGWTFIDKLRREELAPGVPLVVFSADRDARQKALSLNADAALRKPFDLEELQHAVEGLLQRKARASS